MTRYSQLNIRKTSLNGKDSQSKEGSRVSDKNLARTFDKLKEQILQALVVEKRYRDSNFTASQLAELLHTNTRYVSIVLSVRYHANFSQFVNRLRIEEAMALLQDQRYAGLRIEEISDMVGFANRQSFYRAFCQIVGKTPRQYQDEL